MILAAAAQAGKGPASALARLCCLGHDGLQQSVGLFSSQSWQQRGQAEASTSGREQGPRERITKAQLMSRLGSASAPGQLGWKAPDASIAGIGSDAAQDALVRDHQLSPNVYQRWKGWHTDLSRVLRRHNAALPSLPGQVILARVMRVTEQQVFVDPGYHNVSELPRGQLDVGHVHSPAPGSPLSARSGMQDLRVGDVIRVKVDSTYTPYGDMQLETVQQDPELRLRVVWKQIAEAQSAGKPVFGRVLNQCQGGYAVGVAGVVALLPYSRATAATAQRVGELLPFYVEVVDQRRQRLVLRDAKLPRDRLGRLGVA